MNAQDIRLSAELLADNEIENHLHRDSDLFGRFHALLTEHLVNHSDEWASEDEDDQRYLDVIESFWFTL